MFKNIIYGFLLGMWVTTAIIFWQSGITFPFWMYLLITSNLTTASVMYFATSKTHTG